MFRVGLAVVFVGGAAIGVYMYVRMDDEIRRHVEGLLAEHYPQLTVRVGGARIVEGKGIAVYDLTIADPAAPPGSDEILAIDELLLVCDAKLTKLMGGAPHVERIEIKQPRVSARRNRTGAWNLAALIPRQPAAMKLPQVVVHGGALSITDEAAGPAPPLALRDFHLSLAPAADSTPAAPSFRLDGTCGGSQAKRIELHAAIAAAPWRATATLSLEQFQINPPLLAWVQSLVPARLRTARVSGALDGQMTLAWRDFRTAPEVHGALALSGGRLDDPRLPAPVTELAGRLEIDGQEQRLIDLHGQCGLATVAASLNRSGWSLRSPFAVSARATGVNLDAPVYRLLATARDEGLAIAGILCEQWDRFQPAGVVDATLQGSFDGETWTPTATLRGQGLSFESDKFASAKGAYRLTNGSGAIRCLPAGDGQPKRVLIDLVGYSRQTPLHIEGIVIDPKPGAAGRITITGQNLEVEQGMLDSIPNDKCREVIGQLHPEGRFNLSWMLERTAVGAEPETHLTLELTDLRVNYDQFPYPLSGIRGTIEAHNNHWTFQNLVSAGRRPVYGGGYLKPLDADVFELWFELKAQQASLDETLYAALRPDVQRAWTELNPWGQVDVHATVLYHSGSPKPTITVALQPRELMQIRPTFFPYLLEKVSGTISYRDGQIELRDMRARNDRTIIATNGSGRFGPEGQWWFQLSGLTADHLGPSLELVSAMPQKLRSLIERLKPSGNFTVHDGVLAFTKSASEIEPLKVEWDIQIDCHQTDLQCGIALNNIHGSVRLAGVSNGVRTFSGGDLALENVTIKDVQITNVRGPIYVNENRCLLGKQAAQQLSRPEQPITANAYDGALAANAWVTFDSLSLPAYAAEVRFTGADLRRLIVERFHGQREFNGKVDGDMVVGGRGYQIESLVGDGHMHIRDADLYELSLLASLLKMLTTGASNKTAFTEGDITFGLQGRHIELKQIDFLGDVVNLYGHGTTDFDQNLALIFEASILPRDSSLPLVSSFVKQAKPKIVQMYVNGTLSEPKVATEAFPGFAEMIQHLGNDLRRPMEGAEQRQAQRRRLAAQQPALRQE